MTCGKPWTPTEIVAAVAVLTLWIWLPPLMVLAERGVLRLARRRRGGPS